jgi:hypothetical protein
MQLPMQGAAGLAAFPAGSRLQGGGKDRYLYQGPLYELSNPGNLSSLFINPCRREGPNDSTCYQSLIGLSGLMSNSRPPRSNC